MARRSQGENLGAFVGYISRFASPWAGLEPRPGVCVVLKVFRVLDGYELLRHIRQYPLRCP
jgi:hypothetical protein